MGLTISSLNQIKHRKFRNNQLKQPASLKVNKSLTWYIGKHYFIEFINNSLTTYYFYSISIALKSIKCIVFNDKIQLSSKPYTTHHAKGIV